MTAWDPPTKWGWATDRDAELWNGSYDSQAEAVAAAEKALVDEPDAELWVVYGWPPDPAQAVSGSLVTNIIEWMAEYANDEWGEASEDWPDHPNKEARDELNAFVDAWVRKHCPTTFWIASGPKMLIDRSGMREVRNR